MDTDAEPRAVDIALNANEVMTLELDSISEADPDALVEALVDGRCSGMVWCRIATEYWRQGMFSQARKLAERAEQCKCLRVCTTDETLNICVCSYFKGIRK